MRKILLLTLLLISASLQAEDFKILFLNTDNIKIGKTIHVAGDVFSDSEKIHWKDGKQAMKVISLETKRQYVLVSEDFKQRRIKSAKEYILKNNRLSTRGSGQLSRVAAQFGDRVYCFNPTLITIDYKLDDGEFFFLLIGERAVPLEMDGSQVILDERIWGEGDGSPIQADFFIQYVDGKNELIRSGVLLIPLPSSVQVKR